MRNIKGVFLVSALVLASCMQSNKKTFEEFADISIPPSARVIVDEYHDMGQDYEKILNVQLGLKSDQEIIHSILKSKFYINTSNESALPNFIVSKEDNRKGVWYRNHNGYSFHGSTLNERDDVTVTVDTVQMMARFVYSAD